MPSSFWRWQRATVTQIAREISKKHSPGDRWAAVFCSDWRQKLLDAIASGALPHTSVTLLLEPDSLSLRLRAPSRGIDLLQHEARKIILEKEDAADRIVIEMDAVRAWETENAAPSISTTPGVKPNPLPVHGHQIKALIATWYRDDWVNGGARKWLANQGRLNGMTPSEGDDLAAAREALGTSVTRDMVRKARKQFAPPEWKRSGKRKTSI